MDRALTLLKVADPTNPRAELASLRIGDRDRRLLELRRQIIGDRLDAEAECPACGQRVEITARISQLMVADQDETAPRSVTVEIEGFEVEVRPADSRDLAAAAVRETVEEAHQALLERCVVRVAENGVPIEPANLTDGAAAEISRVLSELDPQANTELDLHCPRCHGEWRQAFDIGDYLWGEVTERARRLLHEVHTLAWAYGWSENEILGLSDGRRRVYLEQVESWQTT